MVFKQNLLSVYDHLQICNHSLAVEIILQWKQIASICIYLFYQMQNLDAYNAYILSKAGSLYHQHTQYYLIG